MTNRLAGAEGEPVRADGQPVGRVHAGVREPLDAAAGPQRVSVDQQVRSGPVDGALPHEPGSGDAAGDLHAGERVQDGQADTVGREDGLRVPGG